jgi:hypothetical protein
MRSRRRRIALPTRRAAGLGTAVRATRIPRRSRIARRWIPVMVVVMVVVAVIIMVVVVTMMVMAVIVMVFMVTMVMVVMTILIMVAVMMMMVAVVVMVFMVTMVMVVMTILIMVAVMAVMVAVVVMMFMMVIMAASIIIMMMLMMFVMMVAIVIMVVVMMMVAFMMAMMAMVVTMLAVLAMVMAAMAMAGKRQIHYRGARHYGPGRGSEPRDEIPTGSHSHVLLAPSLWRSVRALLRDPLARTHVQTRTSGKHPRRLIPRFSSSFSVPARVRNRQPVARPVHAPPVEPAEPVRVNAWIP